MFGGGSRYAVELEDVGMNKAEAATIAAKYVKTLRGSRRHDYTLLEYSLETSVGWVFWYQSRKYVETGDFTYAVFGLGPVLVDKRDGSAHLLKGYPEEWDEGFVPSFFGEPPPGVIAKLVKYYDEVTRHEKDCIDGQFIGPDPCRDNQW